MKRLTSLALILLIGASSTRAADIGGEKNRKADSRATFVHRIPLKDENGLGINPRSIKEHKPDKRNAGAPPYSPMQTCATCHPTVFITHGWHFNAMEKGVDPGRNGEPWIYVDGTTRTVLPLSYRNWKGAFKPAQAGLTDWDMAHLFGRQMPGGSFGAPPQSAPSIASTRPATGPNAERWKYTGRIEVDCMICHSSQNHHDASERGVEISRLQNFRWAATKAMGFAEVSNYAASMGASGDDDEEDALPPRLTYDERIFDEKGNVYFDIIRRPPASRCYFCHTTYPRQDGKSTDQLPRWTQDGDIHVINGINCSECHRNGIDHKVTRGFAGEDPSRDTLTCEGCHMGAAKSETDPGNGGRIGAPVPKHIGLPPIHLEKLSCTACHSGPYPTGRPQFVQTSMAHALGLDLPNRQPNSLPQIAEPVFLKGPDGKLAPNKMVWPSYWGRKTADGKVTVVPAAAVIAAAKAGKVSLPRISDPMSERAVEPLSDETVGRILLSLKAAKNATGEPVFINGGKLFALGADGKLAGSDDPSAAPYAWPIAHDVRGAGLSLGARGCTDCHSQNSPVFFAKVTPLGPVDAKKTTPTAMIDFFGGDSLYQQTFALSFKGRTLFKTLILICSALVGLTLLAWAMRGLAFASCRTGNGAGSTGGESRDDSTSDSN